jgi:hypothetical protein
LRAGLDPHLEGPPGRLRCLAGFGYLGLLNPLAQGCILVLAEQLGSYDAAALKDTPDGLGSRDGLSEVGHHLLTPRMAPRQIHGSWITAKRDTDKVRMVGTIRHFGNIVALDHTSLKELTALA